MKDETILEITEKVELAITTISDKIGIGADKFYPIITQQKYIEGWIYLVLSVPLFLVASFLLWSGIKNIKTNAEAENWAIVFSIIFYIAFIVVFGTNIMRVINPEYYAFKEITSLLK